MLDFFLVLGQVPGTRFFLTFTELFSAYTIALTVFILQREYRLRIKFLVRMRVIYVMYSTRVRPGSPKKRAILPAHIDLTPLIRSDFENFRKRLEPAQRQVHLSVERILQRGSFLRRPTGGAF
jgi:hypothetical protein